MDSKAHWEAVYRTKRVDDVSWFQATPSISLELIGRATPGRSARIIDVGGGASTLVDGLLERGYSDVTVLDVSDTALAKVRARLGDAASRVRWLAADALTVELPDAHYDLWHDRAVFHFLIDRVDRDAYMTQVRRAVRRDGYVLIATFAEDGPTTCSGLPVARYSAEALLAEFAGGFELIESVRERHRTPSGSLQSFVYCLCRFHEVPLKPDTTDRRASAMRSVR
jgi:ubiquinone/menaquinone biosynthesis C-methylase UbiE